MGNCKVLYLEVLMLMIVSIKYCIINVNFLFLRVDNEIGEWRQ